MRASKTIISILQKGFQKIKQDGKVMVIDEKSSKKLYNRLRLVETDEGTYKVAFENDSKKYKDILTPGNRWLAPNAYLRIFGKKFILVLMWINLKVVQKVKFPKKEWNK